MPCGLLKQRGDVRKIKATEEDAATRGAEHPGKEGKVMQENVAVDVGDEQVVTLLTLQATYVTQPYFQPVLQRVPGEVQQRIVQRVRHTPVIDVVGQHPVSPLHQAQETQDARAAARIHHLESLQRHFQQLREHHARRLVRTRAESLARMDEDAAFRLHLPVVRVADS